MSTHGSVYVSGDKAPPAKLSVHEPPNTKASPLLVLLLLPSLLPAAHIHTLGPHLLRVGIVALAADIGVKIVTTGIHRRGPRLLRIGIMGLPADIGIEITAPHVATGHTCAHARLLVIVTLTAYIGVKVAAAHIGGAWVRLLGILALATGIDVKVATAHITGSQPRLLVVVTLATDIGVKAIAHTAHISRPLVVVALVTYISVITHVATQICRNSQPRLTIILNLTEQGINLTELLASLLFLLLEVFQLLPEGWLRNLVS